MYNSRHAQLAEGATKAMHYVQNSKILSKNYETFVILSKLNKIQKLHKKVFWLEMVERSILVKSVFVFESEFCRSRKQKYLVVIFGQNLVIPVIVQHGLVMAVYHGTSALQSCSTSGVDMHWCWPKCTTFI